MSAKNGNGKPEPDFALTRKAARGEVPEPGAQERALLRARTAVKARPNEAAASQVDNVLNDVAVEHLPRLRAIYEEVLSLDPDPEWKPSSKLDFRARQLTQVERLLNRVQGMPIQRQRFVNSDDEDVERDIKSLPAPVVERMLIALVSAQRGESGALDDVVEAEVVEDEKGEP